MNVKETKTAPSDKIAYEKPTLQVYEMEMEGVIADSNATIEPLQTLSDSDWG